MNATLNSIDPESVGDVMTSGLALPGTPSVPVGFWTSWAMPDAHRNAIVRAYGQLGWRPLVGSEGQVLGAASAVPAWGLQRFWLFDGLTVSSERVLDALGLVTLTSGGE